MKNNKQWLLALLFIQILTMPAWAGSKLINVQGKITDNAGKLLSGTVTVTFRMYKNINDPVGSAVWVETQGFTATNSLFNVTLGNVTSLDTLPFNIPYYLGMQVSGDASELTPRQLLGASAYALGSLGDFNVKGSLQVNGNIAVSSGNISLQGKDVGNYLLPVGTILPFAGANVPGGYLLCNGSAVSRSTYSGLFAVLGTVWGAGDGSTTFNLPDFRRRVAVGSGGTGTTVLGNAIGNYGGEESHALSVSEMPPHAHGVNDPGHSHSAVFGAAWDPGSLPHRPAYRDSNANNTTFSVNSAVTGITIQSAGGNGTPPVVAPHNVIQPSAVVNYIIKT